MSLQLSDGMSYGELRECLLKRDRGQQRWGHLVANADAVPVEIDRVEWKGGKKGDGKKGGGRQRWLKRKKDGKDGKGKGQGKDLGSKARAKPASLEIAGSVARQGIWLKTV